MIGSTALILFQVYFSESLQAQVSGVLIWAVSAMVFLIAYAVEHPEMPWHSVLLIVLINVIFAVAIIGMILMIRRMLESLVWSLLGAIRMRERAMDLFLRVVPRHIGARILQQGQKNLAGEKEKGVTGTSLSSSLVVDGAGTTGVGTGGRARSGTSEARGTAVSAVTNATATPNNVATDTATPMNAARNDGSNSEVTLANVEDHEESCTIVFGKLEFPREMQRCETLVDAEASLRQMTEVIDLVDRVLRATRTSALFRFFDKTKVRGTCDLTKIESQPGLFIVMSGHDSEPNYNHELWCATAALAIRDSIGAEFPNVSVKMGIDTGPVTGALLGETGLVYSVYGDTVNVSARLASLCGRENFESSQIVLSSSTMQGLREKGSQIAFSIRQVEGIAIKGKKGLHIVGDLKELSHMGRTIFGQESMLVTGGMSSKSRGSNTTSLQVGGSILSGRSHGHSGRKGTARSRTTARSLLSGRTADFLGTRDNVDGDSKVTSKELGDEVSLTMREWLAEISKITLVFRDAEKELRYRLYAALATEFTRKLMVSTYCIAMFFVNIYGMFTLREQAVERDSFGNVIFTEAKTGKEVGGVIVLAGSMIMCVMMLLFSLRPRKAGEAPLGANGEGIVIMLMSFAADTLMLACSLWIRGDWFLYFLSNSISNFVFMSGVARYCDLLLLALIHFSINLSAAIIWVIFSPSPGTISNNDLFIFHSPKHLISFSMLSGGVIILQVIRMYAFEARQRMAFAVEEKVEAAVERVTDLVHKSLPSHIVPRVLEAEASEVRNEVGMRNISSSSSSSRLTIAEHFPGVCVFFLDLVSFTGLASNVSTHGVLIKSLRLLLTELDGLTKVNGVLKLFTIGDAYIAFTDPGASREGEAQKVRGMLNFARAALGAVERVSGAMAGSLSGPLECRIGIAYGSLSCGILGTVMPLYRGFGAALEEANEMESTGVRGKIHCSNTIHKIVTNSQSLFSDIKLYFLI